MTAGRHVIEKKQMTCYIHVQVTLLDVNYVIQLSAIWYQILYWWRTISSTVGFSPPAMFGAQNLSSAWLKNMRVCANTVHILQCTLCSSITLLLYCQAIIMWLGESCRLRDTWWQSSTTAERKRDTLILLQSSAVLFTAWKFFFFFMRKSVSNFLIIPGLSWSCDQLKCNSSLRC